MRSTIIGLSCQTDPSQPGCPDPDATPRANNCDINYRGARRVYSSGGFVSPYYNFNPQGQPNGKWWDYVGIQVTGSGTMDNPINNDIIEVDSVTFAGFSGKDSCGRSNVAITNSHAGIGKGMSGPDANSGNYGFAVCTPVFLRRLTWHKVKLGNRFKFARGRTQPGRSDDYAFSECIFYDEDGSLSVHMTADGDTDARSNKYPELFQTRLLLADAQRRWPTVYQEECKRTIEDPNWWDTKDEMNAINRCPPWLRREPELLSAALDMPPRWRDAESWDGFVWKTENELKWTAISKDNPVSSATS